jgi:CheY-like chemotaxis protein
MLTPAPSRSGEADEQRSPRVAGDGGGKDRRERRDRAVDHSDERRLNDTQDEFTLVATADARDEPADGPPLRSEGGVFDGHRPARRARFIEGSLGLAGVSAHRPGWVISAPREQPEGLVDAAADTRVSPTFTLACRCDDQDVSRSVLIVDDDPEFLALAGRIVSELGVYVVATAADAAEALAFALNSRPDAALVDVGLPDRDGIDLAYRLSEMPWKPRVVLTSSDTDAVLAIEARQGARRLPFIAKEELAGDALRRVLTDG